MLTTTVDDITASNEDYQHGGRRAFLKIASLGPAVAAVAFNPSSSYADGFGSDDEEESFDYPSAEELERERIAHNASIVKRQEEREAAHAKKQAENQEAKKALASQEQSVKQNIMFLSLKDDNIKTFFMSVRFPQLQGQPFAMKNKTAALLQNTELDNMTNKRLTQRNI